MAVKISAMFRLVDQISDRMEKIGSVGDKAMAKIEKSASKADQAFSKSQGAVNRLSAVYKNFEGNAEQLANAVQRGEKVLNVMEKTEGDTAASTFELSSKIEAAADAQKNLEQTVQAANTAMKNYETVVNDNSSTAEELTAAEEALDNATRELFTAFDKGAEAALDLEDAADKAADKVEGFSEKADEAARKGEEFGDKTSSAIQSVESLLVTVGITKLLSEITGALLDCSAAAETVETSGAKLETLAGSQNMSMLSDQIYTISAATGEAQEGLYEVAYNAISAGTDVRKAAEITEAATKLATAGFTSSSSALSVLTTATNSYGEAAGSAEDITDSLITVQNLGVTTVGELANSMGKSISTAAAYNVSLNNLESAYISVTKAGINTQEGTTYINAIINELGKSSSDVAKILTEETGKSFGELMTSGYSLADVLEIIYNKAGKNSEAMMNLWGSQTAAVASAAIVNQGLDTFNSNLDTLKNSAGATAKAYSIMANTTEFAHNKMNNSMNNLKITVGNQLNPVLKNLYNTASNILDWFSQIVKDHPGLVKAFTAITIGVVAFTAAIAAARIAMIAFDAAMKTGPVYLAISALAALTVAVVAFSSATEEAVDKSKELTATTKAQAEEIDKLNAKYDEAVESHGNDLTEASRLKYKIDELTESYDKNKESVQEAIDAAQKHYDDAKEHVKSYHDTIEQIDGQRTKTYALIQKLEDLVEANDNTAASENKIKSVIAELNKMLPELALNYDDVTSGATSYVDIMKRAADIQYNSDKQQAQIAAYGQATEDLATAQSEYEKFRANLDIEMKNNGYEKYENEWGTYYGQTEKKMKENNNSGYYVTVTEEQLEELANNPDSKQMNTFEQFVGSSTIVDYYAKMKDAEETMEEQQGIIDETISAWEEQAGAAQYAAEHPKDYIEAATTAIEKYQEEINELCDAYAEVYNAALESFEGQFSLFDQASTDSETYLNSTVENAQAALESQLNYWKTYNENISTLKNVSAKDLGLTQDQYDSFMANVQDGSEEAAGLAESMAANIKNGNTDAVKDLAQTYASVKEQQETAADTVADWQTDFYNKLDGIKTKMQNTVNDMTLDDEAKTAAKSTIRTYAMTLREGLGSAIAAANDIKTGVANALDLSGDFAGVVVSNNSTASIAQGYAEGTDYATRGVHLVGEYGPELVVFNGGEQVIPHDDTDAILNRSNDDLSVPESLLNIPTTTYSDSEAGRESKKALDINFNGQGSISIDGSMSKDEVVALVYEYAKPAIMDAIASEIIEEGEGSYDY